MKKYSVAIVVACALLLSVPVHALSISKCAPDVLGCVMPLDSDRDGLYDWVEWDLGTDPLNADTDFDGLLDGEEDLNGDGLIQMGFGETDPLMWDTDMDLLGDGVEIEIGTSPVHADTDGDFIVDSEDPCPLSFINDCDIVWVVADEVVVEEVIYVDEIYEEEIIIIE